MYAFITTSKLPSLSIQSIEGVEVHSVPLGVSGTDVIGAASHSPWLSFLNRFCHSPQAENSCWNAFTCLLTSSNGSHLKLMAVWQCWSVSSYVYSDYAH